MTKIIPFAVAVILVLGAGYYLFTVRMLKVGVPTKVTVTNTDTTNSTTDTSVTPSPVVVQPTVLNEQVNQISLTISEPKDNASVAVSSLVVRGQTAPYADVSVNDKDVKSNANGAFVVTLALEEGDNYVVIVAVDADGNVAEKELSVTYSPNQE